MRGKGVPKMIFWFGLFLLCLGFRVGSKNLVPIFYIFWAQFWIPIFGDLRFLGCLLGAILGLLRLSWEASVAKNLEKTQGFFKVFVNEGFWFFEVPDGSFGLILALLGRSDSNRVPTWVSTFTYKVFNNCLKIVNKMCRFGRQKTF